MAEVNGTKGTSPPGTEDPPPARTPRPKRAAVRRRLLEAALPVFASRGFEKATLDQVAEAAGLTKGAIYSNFASKDELFFAMMSEQALHRAEAAHAILAARPAGPDGQQAVRDIGRLLTERLTRDREWQLVFLDFWGRAVRDDAVRAQFLAHRRALRSAITERITQATTQAPTADLTLDEIVTVTLALSNGLAIEEHIDPGLIADDLLGRILERLSR